MKFHHCKKCKKKIEHKTEECHYSTTFKMCYLCLQKKYEHTRNNQRI